MGNRISYRERYFSDNEAVRVPANNRKGSKIVYRYVGLWKSWGCPKGSLKQQKVIIAALELVSTALYFCCGFVPSPINTSRLASGFGLLSLIPWLLEFSGVLRFVFAGTYVKELTLDEIDKSIRYGCPVRGLLVFLSGTSGLLSETAAAFPDWLLAAGILVSALLSFVIWRCYNRLLLDTYRNADHMPGKQF